MLPINILKSLAKQQNLDTKEILSKIKGLDDKLLKVIDYIE